LQKAREEKRRLTRLKEEMTRQHRAWLEDIHQIHQREISEGFAKVQVIEAQQLDAEAKLKALRRGYEEEYGDAMVEAREVMHSLQAAAAFARTTVERCAEDAARSSAIADAAKEGLALHREGREGTVYDPDLYDSADASFQFLQGKTSALEQWLISRTQFTQHDRERYMKRVELARQKRDEYDENRVLLNGVLVSTGRKMGELEAAVRDEEERNAKIREGLASSGTAIAGSSREAEQQLEREISAVQEEISAGQMEKFAAARALYPKEHELQVQRHAISLLQVELGELKILLEDVNNHTDADAARRTQQQLDAAALARAQARAGDDGESNRERVQEKRATIEGGHHAGTASSGAAVNDAALWEEDEEKSER
jgi:hypothetical protein